MWTYDHIFFLFAYLGGYMLPVAANIFMCRHMLASLKLVEH